MRGEYPGCREEIQFGKKLPRTIKFNVQNAEPATLFVLNEALVQRQVELLQEVLHKQNSQTCKVNQGQEGAQS